MLTLKRFVKRYKNSESTRRGYTLALCLFLEMVYSVEAPGPGRNPEHIEKIEALSVQYLSDRRVHFDDLLSFSDLLTSQYAPMTATGHMSKVYHWMELNDILISKSKLDFIKQGLDKCKPITQDHPISLTEIKSWYEHLTPIGRGILLVQLSSGMRIGEVLALNPEDINTDASPAEVQVTKTLQTNGKIKPSPKNDDNRITFISNEAALFLQEWNKIRGVWMSNAMKKTAFGKEKKDTDTRIFPINATTLQGIFIRGLQKAELYFVDENSHRSTISSHSLRKFFISQLKIAGVPDIIAEGLAGHRGYLSGAYDRVPWDQVQGAYLSAEYAISLNSNVDPREMQDIRKAYGVVISEKEDLARELKSTKAELREEFDTKLDSYLKADHILTELGKRMRQKGIN